MLDTRVLVVDDDVEIRDLVVFKMRQLGYQVASCPDGMSALAERRTHRPDIVLLDLMVPGLSGLDVCRELRRDEGLGHVPVVRLTARAQESDTELGSTPSTTTSSSRSVRASSRAASRPCSTGRAGDRVCWLSPAVGEGPR